MNKSKVIVVECPDYDEYTVKNAFCRIESLCLKHNISPPTR